MPILQVFSWETPATRYAEETLGDIRIHRSLYKRGFYHMWGVDGYMLFHVRRPIPVTLLQKLDRKWHDLMVDDPPHWGAMQKYAAKSYGNVLTTGLGLGLVVHSLVKNEKVESVTVVEINQNVIQLVGKYLPDKKVQVVKDDFYHFIDVSRRAWDVIIVDLWVAESSDEKIQLYHSEVLPLEARLRLKYPDALLVFHGFVTVSDISFH